MFSVSSCICIVAYHLGTLDVQCTDMKHVLTEPNHEMVFGGLVLKREEPAGATEDPAQGLDNINTNLVLPPGKPRCTFYYFKL